MGRSSNRQSRFCGLNIKGLRPLHASPNEKNRFVNGLRVLTLSTPSAGTCPRPFYFPDSRVMHTTSGRLKILKGNRLLPNPRLTTMENAPCVCTPEVY